ncbi:DUF3293 domain-containing protein [Pontibacter roseus]|uniref:DUF3293 domain-containing protein n=1 Tax=Pontibacter roseus TaxID=336989 RepID=UPI000360F590|nr:DUF3293 domain-containing protein [Pontibacter roseus]
MNTPHTLHEDILAAYQTTDFSFTAGDKTIAICLDGPNQDLAAYLERELITEWAYLTAFNPYFNEQTEAFNNEQHKELLERLTAYQVCPGEGRDRAGLWPVEQGVFVAGITRDEAEFLGRDFGQYAILVSGANGEAELLSCPPML